MQGYHVLPHAKTLAASLSFFQAMTLLGFGNDGFHLSHYLVMRNAWAWIIN